MELYSIILAAGEGKRMKSKLAMPLQTAGGKTLIGRVCAAASGAGAKENIVVVGHNAQQIEEHLGAGVKYAYLTKDLDEVHEVMSGTEQLCGIDGAVMILRGNAPLISADTLRYAYERHCEDSCAATAFTTADDEDCDGEMYIFDIKELKAAFRKLDCGETQDKLSLADVYELMKNEGLRVGWCKTEAEEVLRVSDFVRLAEADRLLNLRNVRRLMAEGVRVLNPETVRADDEVRVGCDTVIYPNTILEGNCEIGEDCIIGPNTRLKNCTVGNGTEIQSSVALDSEIGSGTAVGPFAYIRPNSKIGDNIKVGDFVEVKNAVIGDGTKIAHLTYVGDADVGERVNFGCGTVVVNYDGIHKHRTTIEDDCFIGCNTNLVSPVTVRKGAYTAAGSTITDEVPQDALAIARARQVVKEGWAKGKKK